MVILMFPARNIATLVGFMDMRVINKRPLSSLSEDQRKDIKLASSKMTVEKRREFMAR